MRSPGDSPLPVSTDWSIQPLDEADLPALLQLNANSYPAVHTLDEATLDWLLGFDGQHLAAVDAAGTLLGYLLAFASTSAYTDSEIIELRRRVTEPFLYICQVVVAPAHRGRGIARAFYAAMAEAAGNEGLRFLCCDVNTAPPNPGSFAFHHRLGFAEIGRGTASNGFAVAFLAKTL